MSPISEPNPVHAHRAFSADRLAEVTQRLERSAVLARWPQLFLYACGSYGRLEAGQRSDLDLFMVATRAPRKHGSVDSIQVKDEVIRIAAELSFPEFDRGGAFLKLHHLPSMLSHLGSPKDDYRNSLTARLLLLLESRPLYNRALHQQAVAEAIGAYFRNYPGRESSFRPLFLVNDVKKYYFTLWLNQDERQNKRKPVAPPDRAKNRLKRLKLQFSRRVSCFSMIIPLLAADCASPAHVAELSAMTPLERLQAVALQKCATSVYSQLEGEYGWFLSQSYRPDIYDRILDQEYWDGAWERAEGFRRTMFALAVAVIDPPNQDLLSM